MSPKAQAKHQALLAYYQSRAQQLAMQQNAQMNALYNQATGAHLYNVGTSATTATMTTAVAVNHPVYWAQSNHTTTAPVPVMQSVIEYAGDANIEKISNGVYEFGPGTCRELRLPDGLRIGMGYDGGYEIEDKDAKVIYRAATRDFNPFLNASDKIEDFIKFCGQHGVRQNEMLQLPLQLFIAWLVIEAAKADQEPEPDIPLIPQLKKRLDCRCRCGRFMSRTKRDNLRFCRVECFEIAAYDEAKNPRLANKLAA